MMPTFAIEKNGPADQIGRAKMKREQLEVFNDAVIAIVITLMVLEIKLPELPGGDLWLLARHIGIYALSFVFVAIVWLNLRIIFRPIEWVCNLIIWLDLLLLFMISLVPLPTQAMGEFFLERESHIFYGLVLALLSVAYALLHWQIIQHSKNLDRKCHSISFGKNYLAIGLYSLSIPLSFVSLYLSAAIFILIPALYFLPSQGGPMEEAGEEEP